jgi:predicted CoA-binding protein
MDFVKNSFAIVGASNNSEKYGFKVLNAILKKTKNVYPINPKENEILGLKCYKELKEIKENVNVIVFVVPPVVTLEILKKNFAKNSLFWFQIGSFDESVIIFCEQNGLEYENKKCIIKESEKTN